MECDIFKEIREMHLSKKKSTFKIEDVKILNALKDKDLEVKLIYRSDA